MDFNQFLKQAWGDHATKAAEVALRIPAGIQLIEENNQIPLLANLVTHLFGEHLGRWSEGVQTLQRLKQLAVFESGSESDKAIDRFVASLEVASGARASLDGFVASDQIRVLTIAASALSEQKQAEKAQALFLKALDLARSSLPKEDPANRSLAIAGNSVACALEERASRNAAETELMILAAQTARKYWEVAGTWLEIERAEYRLAQTYLKAGDLDQALGHAKKCLEIVQQNKALPLEFFFAYEALGLIEKACGNSAGFSEAVTQATLSFEKLIPENKSWCEPILKKLTP